VGRLGGGRGIEGGMASASGSALLATGLGRRQGRRALGLGGCGPRWARGGAGQQRWAVLRPGIARGWQQLAALQIEAWVGVVEAFSDGCGGVGRAGGLGVGAR
jgi:hypothetical protein